jgi:hypothetical protein
MLYMFDLDLGQARLNPSSVFSGYPVLLLGEKRRLLETGENWYLSVWMSNGYDEILVFFHNLLVPFFLFWYARLYGVVEALIAYLWRFLLCVVSFIRAFKV